MFGYCRLERDLVLVLRLGELGRARVRVARAPRGRAFEAVEERADGEAAVVVDAPTSARGRVERRRGDIAERSRRVVRPAEAGHRAALAGRAALQHRVVAAVRVDGRVDEDVEVVDVRRRRRGRCRSSSAGGSQSRGRPAGRPTHGRAPARRRRTRSSSRRRPCRSAGCIAGTAPAGPGSPGSTPRRPACGAHRKSLRCTERRSAAGIAGAASLPR